MYDEDIHKIELNKHHAVHIINIQSLSSTIFAHMWPSSGSSGYRRKFSWNGLKFMLII